MSLTTGGALFPFIGAPIVLVERGIYPQPMSLWKQIISVSSVPTKKIEDHEQLRGYWRELCRKLRIFEPTGRAVLSLGGMAGDTWQLIQCEPENLIPALDGTVLPEPEFVVMNEECSTMAAVTTEEYEYWVFAGRKLSSGWALLSHADAFSQLSSR